MLAHIVLLYRLTALNLFFQLSFFSFLFLRTRYPGNKLSLCTSFVLKERKSPFHLHFNGQIYELTNRIAASHMNLVLKLYWFQVTH